MAPTKITINGVQFPVKFGYGAIRLLAGIWELPGFVQVVDTVGKLVPADGKEMDMGIETMDRIADIVWAGMANASPDAEVESNKDVIIDAIFADMTILTAVFGKFMESMPKAPAGKEQPKATATKKKK